MGDENLPPSTAHVGQRDLVSIFFAVASDERENFWGDPIDRRESVLHGPGKGHHFQNISLEKFSLG